MFLFHFLPGATKKVQFGTRELPGANIHKPHRTGYREFALGGIKVLRAEYPTMHGSSLTHAGNGRTRLSSLERRLSARTWFFQTGNKTESCSNGLAHALKRLETCTTNEEPKESYLSIITRGQHYIPRLTIITSWRHYHSARRTLRAQSVTGLPKTQTVDQRIWLLMYRGPGHAGSGWQSDLLLTGGNCGGHTELHC